MIKLKNKDVYDLDCIDLLEINQEKFYYHPRSNVYARLLIFEGSLEEFFKWLEEDAKI